jgi:hypothetical protein
MAARHSHLALPDPGWTRQSRHLHGDLDNIVLKALAKWPAERYAGAAALGGLGLLSGLAATVQQGRDTLALGAMGMGGGLVMALLQARRPQATGEQAERARDEATRHLSELRRLANHTVFEVTDALERGVTEGRRALVQTAAQARQMQDALAARGINREAQWLAAQPD